MRSLRPFLVLMLALAAVAGLSGCKEPPVKRPAVAGAFYPDEPNALREQIGGFLSNASIEKQSGDIVALISPHAGYIYSGQVAAHGYKAIEGMSFDTVVLIGGAHRVAYEGASVWAGGLFETPLGLIRVDDDLARRLIKPEAQVTFSPEAYEGEHSLEVQLPFLQSVLKGNFRIVPVLISQPTREMFDHLALELTQAASRRGKRILIIASTDLSHFHSYDRAVTLDTQMISALERLSVTEAQNLLYKKEGEMCGAYAVMLTMEVARRLGANRAEVFEYKNSGDVTGDRGRVVGYVSVGIYRDPLGKKDRKELLALARSAVRGWVLNGMAPDDTEPNPRFRADGAAFVTLNRNGMLRGCIGHIQPVEPLYLSVIHNAQSAATRDRRFRPVQPEELDELTYEVSVLSPMLPVTDVNEIEVGTHGLYIMKGGRTGVLLPQVPVEQGWDRAEYLRQICRKAGLPPDAWQHADARLWSFTAEVIH